LCSYGPLMFSTEVMVVQCLSRFCGRELLLTFDNYFKFGQNEMINQKTVVFDHFAKYDIMVTEVNMNDGKKSTGLQIWKNSTMAQLVLDRLSNTHIYYDGLNRCERSASKVNASEINPLLLSSFFDDIPVSLYDFWNFIKENEYQTVQNVPGVTTYSKNITLQNHTAAVTIDLFDPAYLLPKGGSFNVPLHMNILMYEKAGEEVGKVVGNVSYSFFGFNANLTENDKEKYFLLQLCKTFNCIVLFSHRKLIYSDEQKVIAFTNNPDSNLTFNRVVNVTNLNSFVIHDFNSGIQYVVDANSMHCIAVSALPPMSGDARILNQTTAYTLIALKSATDILTMFDQFTYGYVGKRMYDENFFDVWISRGENQTVNSSTVYELWMQTNGKVHLASYTFFNFAAVDVRQTLWKNAHIQPCLRFEENNSYLSFTVNRTISKLNDFGVKEIEKGLVERLSAIADISPLRFSTFSFQPNGNNTFVFFQLANVADINGTRTETYKEEKNLIVAVDTLNKTLEGDNIVVVVHNFQGDSMNSFAEALYDNNAEWPDELTFRRGDVLKVLERNPAKGLAQGWWLCFDPSTGKTGIAPSNRLKSMDRPPSSSQSRLITPRRIGDVFVYDQSNFKAVADGNGNGAAHPFDYKKAFLLNDFLPMKNNEIVENVEETEDNRGDVDEEDIYDVPTASTVGRKPVIRNVPITLVREPSEAGLSKKSSAEERSTVVYDSPSVVVQRSSLTSGLLGRGVQRPALVEPTFSKTAMAKLFAAGDASAEGCLHSVGSSSQSSQSDRFSYSSDSSSAGFRGTVPVELESQGKDLYDVPTGTRAKADLTKPTVDALPPVDELSSLCLLSSTAPKPALKQAHSELQQLFDQYKANMATLADSSSLLPFTDAQWSALTKNCRTTLSLLRRLLQLVGEAADPSLQQSVGLMQRLASDMEAPSAMRDADRTYPLMRQFTIVARRSRWQNGKIVPITTTANGEEGNANDADGILNNASTASVADDSAYDFVENVSLTNRSHSNGSLDVDDRRLLRFYSSQIDSHIHCLSSAIDDFLAAVENNQPPRSFIGLGKLVILAAHKLVYIGDNIAQCVHSRSVQLIVTEHADRLCDVLRACVASTKLAAQNYPAIPSIQAMISSVVAVSQSAQQLRLFVNNFLPMKNNEIVENVEETEANRGDVDEEDIYDVPTASTVGRKPVIRNVPITLVREPSEAGLSKKSSAEERSTVVYDSPSVVVQRSSLTSGLLGRGVQRPALVEPTFSKTAMAKLFAAGDASAEGCLHSVGSSSQSSQSDRFSYSSDSSSAGFRGTVPVELESQGKDLYDVPTGTRAKADLTKPTVDALPPVDELSSLCLLSSTAPKPALKQAHSELQQLFDQYKANMATLADSSSLLPFTDAQWSALTKNCRTTLSLLRRLLQLVGEAADPSLQQSVGLMQRLASDMEAPSAMRDADRTYPLMRQFTIVARRVLDQLRMHLNNFNNNNNKQSRWQNGKIVPITTTANGEEGNANDADGILNNASTASVADDSAYDFVENVSLTNRSHSNGSLDVDDRRLLRFYSSQIDSHIHCLSSAIDDFLAAVENNQPPRSFIGLGKLVILAAHKLVYIGDNIAQCVHSRSVQLIVTEHADRLCDVLRECVASTKLAAQNYPAIPSIQAMISSVVAVSQSAQQLRLFVNIPLLGGTKRALSG
ncbi:Breast cancer anti-estrogen resistance protein 1, partial [Trichinella sp. T8]